MYTAQWSPTLTNENATVAAAAGAAFPHTDEESENSIRWTVHNNPQMVHICNAIYLIVGR